MKPLKKLFLLLLALVMGVVLIACGGDKPTDESRADHETDSAGNITTRPGASENSPGSNLAYSSGLVFISNGDGTCYVAGIGTCKDTELNIPPESPEGDRVTSIGESAFESCDGLVRVVLPEGVTEIGRFAFMNCDKMTELSIPDGVIKIGVQALHGCSSLPYTEHQNGTYFGTKSNPHFYLKSIIDKDVSEFACSGSTKIIGEYAFGECGSLQTVTLPDGLVSIGNQVFEDCVGLTAIVIPDSVQYIGNYVFNRCETLTDVSFGNGVSEIGYRIFEDCRQLTYTEYENGKYLGNTQNPYLFFDRVIDRDVRSFSLADTTRFIDDGAFNMCSNLEEIVLPSTLRIIAGQAFAYCDDLTAIVIPDSVIRIDDKAFLKCSDLESIYIGTGVREIGTGILEGCYDLRSIVISEMNPTYHTADNCLIHTKDQALISGCVTSQIPDDGSVTSIEWYAFAGQEYMATMKIPNTVTFIGDYVFSDCENMKYITFDGTVAQWNAITKGGNGNTSINKRPILCTDGSINDAPADIQYFSQGLVFVSGGNGTCSVTGIGTCTDTVIVIPLISPEGDVVTEIGMGAFDGNTDLTSVTIPGSIRLIGIYAFGECTSLAEIIYEGGEAQWRGVVKEGFWDKSSGAYTLNCIG